MTSEPRVAAFRPADGRAAAAAETIRSLGGEPLIDPMLAVEPTATTPAGADWVVFTSKTGVSLVADAGWSPGEARIAAIGETTATAAREAGWSVALVPEEFSSAGLVRAFADRVEESATVELARSDHGSAVLPEGLADRGFTVRETTLYRLVVPSDAGDSTEAVARGTVDGVAFTSSLTVEHFLSAAADRGVRDDAVAGLEGAVVGVIGEPTAETAREHGVAVDVIPENAAFDALAARVVARARE